MGSTLQGNGIPSVISLRLEFGGGARNHADGASNRFDASRQESPEFQVGQNGNQKGTAPCFDTDHFLGKQTEHLGWDGLGSWRGVGISGMSGFRVGLDIGCL